MNRRLLFLAGHLSGLLIGVVLAWAYTSSRSTDCPVLATTPQGQILIPVKHPFGPNVPQEWQQRDFNGQTYFIIPLDRKERPAKI